MVNVKTLETGECLSKWHVVAGAIMIMLGVYLWFNPEVTLLALALYLGVALIVIGVGYMASLANESGWYLLAGMLDIFVGVIFVTNLGITAVSLPIIFALWCLAVGVIQIVTSYRLYKSGFHWSWALLSGAVSVLFAFLMLAYPVLGEIAITILIGSYSIIYGIIEILEYAICRKIKIYALN